VLCLPAAHHSSLCCTCTTRAGSSFSSTLLACTCCLCCRPNLMKQQALSLERAMQGGSGSASAMGTRLCGRSSG
jgi:hypothetical protein